MSRRQLSDLDFGNASRIRNLPNPINPDEPARQSDLNSAIQGLAWKDSIRVAAQVNITLASPGATIDGITIATGDRILLKAQTAAAENGIYIWNGATVAMTRSPDAATAIDLEQATATIEEGTNAGTTWRQTSINFILDTDPIAWTSFGSSVSQASETSSGIAELATQAEVDAGTDNLRIVTPLKLSSWMNRAKRAQATIGDGTATQFTVTHNFATRDVIVQIYESSGLFQQVNADVSAPTVNTIQLNFAAPPTAGAYRVVVIA